MFEAEMEMEKKQGGSFGPVLIIILMVLVVFGGVGYLVWQGRQTVKPEEASAIITAAWMEHGPAKVSFHTGLVTPDVNETTSDPHYRLMSNLGLMTTKPAKNGSLQADLTPAGQQTIAGIPEFQKKEMKNGVALYKVPLATKEIVKIEKVTWVSPTTAQVVYTWKWKPNELGKEFDASSDTVKKFNAYERSTLIQKYGVDFYSAAPVKETVRMSKKDGKWQLGD